MKKVSVLLFAVVSFILMISPAANAALVYDSGQLPIGKWHVHLSKHTFNADAAKNGVLSISRQAPGLAIHVGFVILNRRLIPLKRFLNGPDVTFQKKVRLKQRNRLRVFLIGSPGAAVGITIHTPAENQPPPTAALHAAPETIVAGAACTLTWSSEYADTCTIEPGIGSGRHRWFDDGFTGRNDRIHADGIRFRGNRFIVGDRYRQPTGADGYPVRRTHIYHPG
jgi:hypothetical protein